MEDEIKQFSDFLKQQRDEINLKLHLGGMEAKEEMEKAEEIWESFLEKADEIGDETKETTLELIDSAKSIGDDLKDSYEKLVSRLS
jgi:intergrase/recombinase